ncbi:MAG: site-specific integrase [Dysgonamonadaceae bacterium]|jgi:integrase|nr:site-specific integrase [Dysgonamonadaceae bacterium]
MRSTFKVLFFLKRDKQKANRLIPLYCRITVDGKEARFGMKCDVNPKYWDVETGKATGRTAEAVKTNALVDNTKSTIYKIYRELQERDNYVTAEKVKNVFLGIEAKHQTVLELFDYHNRERELQIDVNLSKSTYDRYCTVRQIVSDFILYKYNLHDIPVKEVNHQFLSDFEIYLLTIHEYSKNTVVLVMKKFRHIIEMALNKEWIYRNPFKEFKLQWQKVDRGYLTQSELEAMIDFQFEDKRLEKARDIFIFCAFTGLAYADVKHLTNSHIQFSFDGKLWIKGKRKKTDTEYNIPILNIPKVILEKYKGKAEGDLAIPVFDIVNYNILLKKIAQLCGISKNVSSHLARHTFATLTLTKGVSIESVSKMLGHANIQTTQIYARVTEKKVSHEMGAFAGNVKKLDMKLQFSSNQEKEVPIDNILKSLKISIGKASDTVWENLTAKVWNKLSNIEKQSFVSDVGSMENKPKTFRDFYVFLMDYFLNNLTNQSDSFTLTENELANEEIKSTV